MGAWTDRHSGGPTYDPASRGRRDLPRPDPDRHDQLRRRRRAGGAEGGRVRRGAARRGRDRVAGSTSPSRAATIVVARWGGAAAAEPGLLLHGHLDVVPAAAEDWQVDPFSGEIQDGYVWGRGAVDMKDFDAMLLSSCGPGPRAGRRARRGRSCCASPPTRRPAATRAPRSWSSSHPEQFDGCTEAVGEVGGFSATVRGRRIYLIEAAEKGMAWMRLTARGRAGHGSMINRDNAVTRLAAAVARIGAHEWPVRLTPDHGGAARDRRRARRHRGDAGERRGAGRGVRHAPPGCSARSSATPPTRPCSSAGYKVNVDPDRGHGARRRPVPARATRTSSSPPSPSSCGERHRRSTTCRKQPPWETPYDGDAGRRDDAARSWPRTRTRSSRRTS